jgi:hypothetical protein
MNDVGIDVALSRGRNRERQYDNNVYLRWVMLRSMIGLVCLGSALMGCNYDGPYQNRHQDFLTSVVDLGAHSQRAISKTELGSNIFGRNEALDITAQEIAAFVETQVPCAAVTVSDATVNVEYGVNEGSCSFRGNELEGTHTITVTKNDTNEAVVSHTWNTSSDGRNFEGTATVTVNWIGLERTVHFMTGEVDSEGSISVQAEHSWVVTPLASGKEYLLDEPPVYCVNGCTNEFVGAEFRWGDSVPQKGTFAGFYASIGNGGGGNYTIKFERLDETTIKATVTLDNQAKAFHVSSDGIIEPE